MKKYIIIIIALIFLSNISAEEIKNPWSFSFALGLNLNKGNTDKIGGSSSIGLERMSQINEFVLKINGFYSETEKKKDTNKGDLTFKYDHNFLKSESFFVFIIPSYNEFQNLKYRLQTGTGLKHTFYKNNQVDYSLSGAVLYEVKQNPGDNEKDELARLSFRPKIKYSFNESGRAYLVLFYQPKVDEFEDYRILSEFILEFNIYKKLFFEFKIADEYNNFVPADIKRNDLAVINAIKLKL